MCALLQHCMFLSSVLITLEQLSLFFLIFFSDVCAALMSEGANLFVYDPKVTLDSALQEFHTRWPKPGNMEFKLSTQFSMTVLQLFGRPLYAN